MRFSVGGLLPHELTPRLARLIPGVREPINVRFQRWSQPVDATLYLKGEMEGALMDGRFHRGFTAAEKTGLWHWWQRVASLKQIAGWLKRTNPEDECNQVSHETIYRSLFVQARGVLKKELLSHLRSKRSMRRSKPVDPNGDRRGHIKDIVSIRQRPAAVEDRAVPGHWEGDLLSGPNNSYIATLVERHTRYVMLAKVAGKDTQTVVSALIKQAKKLPKELYKSLTWDRGKELTDHRRFTLATKIDVYFCDPQSPWQRGSNENTNGL